VEGTEVARTVEPFERQVVYLDPDLSHVEVTAEEYEL
jgi:hypothetical protein